jgi:hypothetical protein
MNNWVKKTKPKKKRLYKIHIQLVRKYKRFNIFTKGGENRTVTAPYPMTLDYAMYYFNALSIGSAE